MAARILRRCGIQSRLQAVDGVRAERVRQGGAGHRGPPHGRVTSNGEGIVRAVGFDLYGVMTPTPFEPLEAHGAALGLVDFTLQGWERAGTQRRRPVAAGAAPRR